MILNLAVGNMISRVIRVVSDAIYSFNSDTSPVVVSRVNGEGGLVTHKLLIDSGLMIRVRHDSYISSRQSAE